MRKIGLATGLLLGVASVCMAQVTFTEFPGPLIPSVVFITTGPDGNLWLTRETPTWPGSQPCNTICRMTTTGVITEFPLPNVGIYGPYGSSGPIVVGPDGNLWYAHYFAHTIGKIDPTTGSITEFSTPSYSSFPAGITAGPDGNLWFTEFVTWKIGKSTPAGVITEYPIPYHYPCQYGPASITAGADGNIWFTVPEANIIGRSTPAGEITEFQVPTAGSYPSCITAGPDGHVWFTEGQANKIGRIDPNTGVITEFPLPPGGANPFVITPGPDGNLWFTDSIGKIGNITSTGVATEYSAPTPGGRPFGITTGPDGNVWFTELYANKIIKVDLNHPPTADAGPDQTLEADSPSGRNVTLDGSGSSDPDDDSLDIEWKDGSGITVGTSAICTLMVAVGTHAFTLTVSDGRGGTASDVVTITVNRAYILYGFDSPIDNVPEVNIAKAGSTIPVKWRLTDFGGAPVSDPSSFKSLTSYIVPPGDFSGTLGDEIEAYSPGASGLQYLGDGYWQFNWKTPKSYAGVWRVMILTLRDGTTRSANFKYK